MAPFYEHSRSVFSQICMEYVDLPAFISFNLIGLPQAGNQSKYWEKTVNSRI